MYVPENKASSLLLEIVAIFLRVISYAVFTTCLRHKNGNIRLISLLKTQQESFPVISPSC